MPFLDNLVSDLVRRSTGFNARPFVRAVGGKNLLLLGGAAIAGALAAEKMRGSSGENAPPPPPLPPPLPGEATAPPPPLPTDSAESAIPGPLLFAIVRTMVAGALADGEMHAEEKKLIEGRLEESGLSPEQIRRVHKDLVLPPSPQEIAALVNQPEDRELLYRFGALVVLADGEAAATEKAWLGSLAKALAIPPERQKALEDEIFPPT